MTRRVKVACATITPSGSEMRKGHAAIDALPVKDGKPITQRRLLPAYTNQVNALVARRG
jgi:hypothetical protein